jgi:DNA-binding transcriptional regulator YiaG
MRSLSAGRRASSIERPIPSASAVRNTFSDSNVQTLSQNFSSARLLGCASEARAGWTLAREVRLIREKTGLSQPPFAARFHIGLARLRDFEPARSEPDFIVRVFL